jgi:hypothetical protein
MIMRTGADTSATGICVISAIDMGNDVCPYSLLPHVHRLSESAPPSLWMACQGILRMGCLWFLCSYTFFPTLSWSHLSPPLGVNRTASSFADRKLHAYASCLQESFSVMRRLISLGIGYDLNPEAAMDAVHILPPQPYPLRSCIGVLGGHLYELVDQPDVLVPPHQPDEAGHPSHRCLCSRGRNESV